MGGKLAHAWNWVRVIGSLLYVAVTTVKKGLAKRLTVCTWMTFRFISAMENASILFINGSFQKYIVWDPALFSGLGGPKEQLNYHVDVEFGFEL